MTVHEAEPGASGDERLSSCKNRISQIKKQIPDY